MTATINTAPTMSNNNRRDPGQRRMDYEGALAAYLEQAPGTLDAIVFCENSGADLSSLRDLAEKHAKNGVAVHFLSYVSDVPPELGKSVAELDILIRAHRDMAALFQGAMVWKVTGRLVVRNLGQIVRGCPADAQVYCDTRSLKILRNLVWSNYWVDTRLIGYTPTYFEKYILPIGNGTEMRQNSIEAAVYDVLRPKFGQDRGLVPRFRAQPVFSGVCGGSNEDYESPSYRRKTAIRSVFRKVAPWIWM